jgi:hypothetical protein
MAGRYLFRSLPAHRHVTVRPKYRSSSSLSLRSLECQASSPFFSSRVSWLLLSLLSSTFIDLVADDVPRTLISALVY